MRRRGTDPFSPPKGDNAAMIRFRQRMQSDEAQAIYKQRS